jgi:prepilin-type N-terminal cleavage/methylation domain-containing protein
MKLKAFTLIELLISISLMALVVTFLYKVIDSLKMNDKQIAYKIEQNINSQKELKLIFLDIFNSTNVTIKNISTNSDELNITTKNSLYENYMPDVLYKVDEEKNLIRVEDSYEDKLSKVKIFRVYKSKNGYLVYLNGDYFEVRRF